MSAVILNGRLVRDIIAENLKSQIQNLEPKPKLVIIQIGDLAESNTYINQKIKFGQNIGAIVELKKLSDNVSPSDLESIIYNLNSDTTVHGIILQVPIPNHLNANKLTELIDPAKDVDGLTTTNQKLLQDNNPKAIIPATTKGVFTLLKYYKIYPNGKKVTVIGRSNLVGFPLAILFRNLGALVTVCHSQTLDLKTETKDADIIAVAVGKINLLGKEHVSKGQTIVDIGINVVDEPESERVRPSTGSDPKASSNSHEPSTMNHKRSLIGDVNFAEVEPIVEAITPVPGGVGPMTVASLFENLLYAYKSQP